MDKSIAPIPVSCAIESDEGREKVTECIRIDLCREWDIDDGGEGFLLKKPEHDVSIFIFQKGESVDTRDIVSRITDGDRMLIDGDGSGRSSVIFHEDIDSGKEKCYH